MVVFDFSAFLILISFVKLERESKCLRIRGAHRGMCANYRNVGMGNRSRNFGSRAKVIFNGCLDALICNCSIDVCNDEEFVTIRLILLSCHDTSKIEVSIA